MPEPPSGTVTFLFSDIEHSTRLLQHLGERYAEVLAESRRLLRDSSLPGEPPTWRRWSTIRAMTSAPWPS